MTLSSKRMQVRTRKCPRLLRVPRQVARLQQCLPAACANERMTPYIPLKKNAVPAATITRAPELRARNDASSAHPRDWKRANAGSFEFKILATSACLQNPEGSAAASVTASPVIASLCNKNEISKDPESWSTYAVQTYIFSLLSAVARAPIAPQVDGAKVIHDDANRTVHTQQSATLSAVDKSRTMTLEVSCPFNVS